MLHAAQVGVVRSRCFAFDGKVADLEGRDETGGAPGRGSKQETRAAATSHPPRNAGAFAPHLSIGRTPHQHRDVMSLATPRNSRGESGEKERGAESRVPRAGVGLANDISGAGAGLTSQSGGRRRRPDLTSRRFCASPSRKVVWCATAPLLFWTSPSVSKFRAP